MKYKSYNSHCLKVISKVYSIVLKLNGIVDFRLFGDFQSIREFFIHIRRHHYW